MDKEIRKVLVIRFSSLGDVVLSTALFPNLRAAWPDADIDVLTKWAYADVFDGNPHINTVRLFHPDQQSYSDLVKEIREHRYDVIVDLQCNIRSWFLRLVTGCPIVVAVKKNSWARRWLLFSKRMTESCRRSVRERILDCLSPLGISMSSEQTQLFPLQVESILNTFDLDPRKKLIGLAPGAQHKTKQWPAQRYAEAANRLGAIENSLIVILGDKKDQGFAQEILPHLKIPYKNLTGWTSIKELTAVMSRFSFLLSNDSGLMHMAEALGVPLVALFGPTVRGFGFFPYRKTSRVVEVINLPCRPCSLHGEERCPLRHHKCMDDIDLNAVMLAASGAMENK